MVGFFEELDIKELVVECVDHAVLIGEQQAKDKFVDSVVDGVKPVVITVEACLTSTRSSATPGFN